MKNYGKKIKMKSTRDFTNFWDSNQSISGIITQHLLYCPKITGSTSRKGTAFREI